MATCRNCFKETFIEIGREKIPIIIGNIVCCEKIGLLTRIFTFDGTYYEPCTGLLSFRKTLFCCPFVTISSEGLINFNYFEGYSLIKSDWKIRMSNNIELTASGEGMMRINKQLKKCTVFSCKID